MAFFLAIPYVLHQLWSFVSPGLYKHEKRLAVPLLLSSILLFYAGIAFAYFAVFPLIFGFLTSGGPAGVAIMTDINRYLDFVLKLFFAFGFAFEIPVATLLLVASGVTNAEALREKRAYVIVGCFVVGAANAPGRDQPDPAGGTHVGALRGGDFLRGLRPARKRRGS